MKYYIYNSKANNGIKPPIGPEIELTDAIGLDYGAFFEGLNPEDEVVFIGGDGTLNYLVNAVDTDNLKNNVYLYGAGTGNDFLRDIGRNPGEEVLVNEYMKNLPTVYVNGIERKFINGIGYGIDGYCCEVADQIKEVTPNKAINYSAIAIKGLLFHYNPHHAKITVDGKSYEYDNVWLAPGMKGRFYGGGLMMTPAQDRKSGKLSTAVYMSKSRLAALMNFPAISKGEHVKNTKMVQIYEGSEIEVTFSEPSALQIDGETVLNVLTYRVKA